VAYLRQATRNAPSSLTSCTLVLAITSNYVSVHKKSVGSGDFVPIPRCLQPCSRNSKYASK